MEGSHTYGFLESPCSCYGLLLILLRLLLLLLHLHYSCRCRCCCYCCCCSYDDDSGDYSYNVLLCILHRLLPQGSFSPKRRSGCCLVEDGPIEKHLHTEPPSPAHTQILGSTEDRDKVNRPNSQAQAALELRRGKSSYD